MPKIPNCNVDLSWRRYVPKPHPEGLRFILPAAFISIILTGLSESGVVGFTCFLITLGIYLFFRDPERVTPEGKNLVIAPADGVICQIKKTTPPPELKMGNKEMTKIAIFMSVLNVHVNRNPVSGKVIQTEYVPGKFINVARDEASLDNERQIILIETPEKQKIVCVQIAGLVARRIVCPLKAGDAVERGKRFGMIRFGSRLEVYVPEGTPLNVIEGQLTVAGETVLAHLNPSASVVKAIEKPIVKKAEMPATKAEEKPVKKEKNPAKKKIAKKGK